MALSRGWPTTRFAVIVSLIVASQVVPASLSTSTSRKKVPECVQLKQWAQANERSLPRTLDAFARLDRGRRQAAFNVISAADKASLWREQMRRFLQRTDVTDAERALTNEALLVLRPEMYASPADAQAASKALVARLNATFMSDEHRRVFNDLGVLGQPRDSFWTASALTASVGAASLLDRLAATATVEAQLCECDVFDWTNYDCSIRYGNWCSWSWWLFCASWWGCGPFWSQECNSMCDWI